MNLLNFYPLKIYIPSCKTLIFYQNYDFCSKPDPTW